TIADPAAAARADQIRRDFTADASKINARWCGDITYIGTWEGWLYLATVIDIASRRVVGYALADHLRTELVSAALANALAVRDPDPGVICHSGATPSHPLCGAEFGAWSVLSGGRVGVAEACPEWFRRACGSGVWKPLRKAALQPMPVGVGSPVSNVTVRPDSLVAVCSTRPRERLPIDVYAERRTAVALPVWAAGLGVPGQ